MQFQAPTTPKGFSRIRFLLIVASLCVLGAGAFLKIRHNTITAFEKKKQERVEQAEAQLERDIQKLVSEVETLIENEDFESVDRLIKKIQVMDLNTKFSEKVHQLKLAKKLKLKEIERREKRGEVIRDINKSIDLNNFHSADMLLTMMESNRYDYLDQSEIEHFRKLLSDKQKRIFIEEETLQGAHTLLAQWKLEEALAKANSITNPLLAEDFKLLNESIVKKLEVHKLLQPVFSELKALDNGKYSKRAEEIIALNLKLTPNHPELLNWQKKFLSYPQVIRVPADVASIDEALAQVREGGGEILLGEGVYYIETLISKNVMIKGISRDKTVIETRASRSAGLEFDTENGSLSLFNLTLRGVAMAEGDQPLIKLINGKLTLGQINISNAPAEGVAVSGGKLICLNVVLRNTKGASLAVSGGQVKMEDFEISESGAHGVSIWGRANVQLSDGSIKKCAQSGCVATERSILTINETEISDNRETGMFAANRARIRVSNVKLSKNLFSGIALKDEISFSPHGVIRSENNGEYGYVFGIRIRQTKTKTGILRGSDNKLGLKMGHVKNIE